MCGFDSSDIVKVIYMISMFVHRTYIMCVNKLQRMSMPNFPSIDK